MVKCNPLLVLTNSRAWAIRPQDVVIYMLHYLTDTSVRRLPANTLFAIRFAPSPCPLSFWLNIFSFSFIYVGRALNVLTFNLCNHLFCMCGFPLPRRKRRRTRRMMETAGMDSERILNCPFIWLGSLFH